MKTQIIKQEKNPFLHREEFLIEIESETNPSFDDVKKEIGKPDELTVVKKIEGHFGRHFFKAEVFVYDSKEFKEKIEGVVKKEKNEEGGGESKPSEQAGEKPEDATVQEEAPKKEKQVEEVKPEQKENKEGK